ncbi:MAG: ATP-binding cassette domain-containing protein [Mariniphaga sp.]
MNEITLNALINLFAIFSAIIRSEREHAIKSFSSYLELHLGISSSEEYRKLFDELIGFYGIDEAEEPMFDMIQQAESICVNIRGRLHRTEQIMLFLRFLELVRKDEDKKKAGELFQAVARAFAITSDDYSKYCSFIYGLSDYAENYPDFLIINQGSVDHHQTLKHLKRENLDGELVFLFLQDIGHYIFIFRGNANLYLEGNPILPGRFYAFKEGGIIRGARISPVYFSDVNTAFFNQAETPLFTLNGQNAEFKFKNSKNGLYEFNFSERSGQLVAIMGGSGVGKSTLLNILNGNIPLDNGRILINNFDIQVYKKETEGLIGFVPQDDLLFEELTVWENLDYNARLCLAGFSEEEISKAVTKVLQELELYDFRDLKVGSPLKKTISGGQRKRLNVALELIREPSILYVDEPTSGLSSMDSEKVMLLLKQQARQGRLVIVNIHQPSSDIFKLFDKLWIMDKGGRMIYTGNPLDAIIYFKELTNHVNALECECLQCGNVNPEQVLEIVETKKIDESGNFTPERRIPPEEWYRLFKQNIEGQSPADLPSNDEIPKTHFRKPGIWKQLQIFFSRNLRIKLSDKQYLLINLIEAPLLALIVGYFTKYSEGAEYIFARNKNLISYVFMAIVVVLFMGMSVSAEEIIKDRKILQRESFLNLSRFSYINSKIAFLLLLSAFQTLAFVLVGNFVIGIHGLNMTYWLVLFSVSVFSNLLGLNISSAFDSVVTIYILIPLLLIPQILLCGVIVKFDDLQDKSADKDAVPIVGELMVSRWAFEALAVEQFRGNGYMADFFEEEKELSRVRYLSDLLLTELLGRVEFIAGQINTGKQAKNFASKLAIIRNEIKELDRDEVLRSLAVVDSITPEKFSVRIAGFTTHHLKELQNFYLTRKNALRKQMDDKVFKLNHQFGKNYLFDLKQKYHNLAIENLVMNGGSNEYYRETSSGLMQKVAPVYKVPDFNFGRAHFLASEKRVFSVSVPTLAFNVLVIWLMTIFLYVALYFDWIRKILNR